MTLKTGLYILMPKYATNLTPDSVVEDGVIAYYNADQQPDPWYLPDNNPNEYPPCSMTEEEVAAHYIIVGRVEEIKDG